MRICPECGHENADTDRYCSNCGASLSNVDVIHLPAPTAPSTPLGESRDIGETPVAQPGETARPQERDALPSAIPPPVDFRPPPGASVEEEWRMTNLGPPPKQRRTWLWVVVGIIGLCLVICIAAAIFFSTDTGQELLSEWATEASDRATEQAD